MLGGIPALLARELATTVRRNAAVFGLYLVAAVLVICAAGYGLNALHTVLSELYGSVAASLWIAGGLLLAAVVAVAIAAYVKSRRPPSRRLEAALAAAPVAATLVGKGKIGWKAGLVGGVILLGLVLGRQLAKGRDGGDEAEK
ncbi:hypothetical protein [Bosea sp. (in: a-proteobacteria)]|jgi:4-amino-4-deoxy-L-arabinose transferase-like glycosyltransferase|uniref:hypothetical protein n=1 Tax=Bosea sp. (in: a-proteobacteria) TaxID=1871050 RepID=UPI00086C7EEF|nr:hypothetical protein [Bosea sp. (in: a-proteobacteria)]MBN9436721.1 hypothetical protein [Bosea sp. (in: a-proteobacteria)]ODT48550.1 MAG: hypothetical protein ABS59_11950 [Methylobacterium sp. SCN 67-24]